MRPQHNGGPLLVYVAGVPWDGVQGSDHRLVEHLCRYIDVLWVDPTRGLRPHLLRRPAGLGDVPGLCAVGERLWRLSPLSLPGVTRPVSRRVARARLPAQVSRALQALGSGNSVAVISNPMVEGRDLPVDRRVFLATDDFVAGTGLMGLSDRLVSRVWQRNVTDADVVLAVSPVLCERLSAATRTVRLFPNGCSPERFWPLVDPAAEVILPRPIAGVIGQLNDRIDLDLVTGVADAGVSVLLVGPATTRTVSQRRKMEALLRRPNVQWAGAQPYERMPEFSASLDLGLTPYTDTDFNRASFPLKTLEYLSAGLPVVSTDLPSARWLGTPYIDIAEPRQFVATVLERIAQPDGTGTAQQRHEFARLHSWRARAEELVDVVLEVVGQ